MQLLILKRNVTLDEELVKSSMNIILTYDLINIWRIRNPTTERFLWRQKNPLIQRRLNFWLFSKMKSMKQRT